MKTPVLCFLSCCVGAVVAAPAFGDVIVEAVGPGVAKAGTEVTVEFFISADPPVDLRGYKLTLPCALTQNDPTGTGTVTVNAVELVNNCLARPDWVMCLPPCSEYKCLLPPFDPCDPDDPGACGGDPIFCMLSTCGGVLPIDQGTCPPADPPNYPPRVGWAGDLGSYAHVDGGPFYLLEGSYDVSPDATGSFEIFAVGPEPEGNDSMMRDPDNQPIYATWVTDKLLIVECTGDDQCDDGDPCTADICDRAGGCVNEYQPRMFGDLVPTFCPPACPQPKLDDFLCLLNDFGDGSTPNGCSAGGPGDYADIAPCGGDGTIDVQDVLFLLDAYAQDFPCPHPCP